MGIFDIFGGSTGGGASRQSTNQSSNFNQTSTTGPWAGIQQYLMGEPGGGGTPGVYPTAASLFSSSGWTPQMQDTAANWFNDTSNARNIFNGNGFQNAGAAMVQGQFDPRITAAGAIAGPAPVAPQTVSPVDARSAQGTLDPTTALGHFLTGDQTNPWIDKQQQAITDQMTRNFNENVLPGIRQTAIADGQYGGSRGDIANTLAVSRLNTDLAPALSQLASNAWDSSQNRGLTTGLALNQQAGDFAQAAANRDLQGKTVNANNLLQTQQFNTGTQLQNNQQAMQAAAQDVANRAAGLNFAAGAQGLDNSYYGNLLQALGLPNTYNWQNLNNYNSIVSPAASLFRTTDGAGTSNSSGVTTNLQPNYSNGGAGFVGNLLGSNGLLGNLFGL